MLLLQGAQRLRRETAKRFRPRRHILLRGSITVKRCELIRLKPHTD
jgi:hypothetical protein